MRINEDCRQSYRTVGTADGVLAVSAIAVVGSGVPRGVVWGVQTPPKFRRYRWSPRSHEQGEPASRFPFAVHCVLIRL